MALTALGLIVSGTSIYGCSLLIAIWGFIGTSSSVGWYVWLTKVVPNDLEQGGGILIAIIQLAITLGAGIDGQFYDSYGYPASFGSARLRRRAEHNKK